MMWSVGN